MKDMQKKDILLYIGIYHILFLLNSTLQSTVKYLYSIVKRSFSDYNGKNRLLFSRLPICQADFAISKENIVKQCLISAVYDAVRETRSLAKLSSASLWTNREISMDV